MSQGSSEVILRNSSSSSFGSFSPRRTNPNYRRRTSKAAGHLAILEDDINNSIEEVDVDEAQKMRMDQAEKMKLEKAK